MIDHPDVEVLTCSRAYNGYLKVDVYRLRHKKFDGSWTEILPPREVCVRGMAVAVLLYDATLDRVVMIEQFRVGAAAGGGPAWMTEIVAGLIDKPGENAEQTARREALEEANLEIGALEFICDYFPSPGAYDERVFVYCGQVDSRGAGGLAGLAAEHEDIRVTTRAADEVIRLMDENRLNNSLTIIAVGWLARHRDRLRQQWR